MLAPRHELETQLCYVYLYRAYERGSLSRGVDVRICGVRVLEISSNDCNINFQGQDFEVITATTHTLVISEQHTYSPYKHLVLSSAIAHINISLANISPNFHPLFSLEWSVHGGQVLTYN